MRTSLVILAFLFTTVSANSQSEPVYADNMIYSNTVFLDTLSTAKSAKTYFFVEGSAGNVKIKFRLNGGSQSDYRYTIYNDGREVYVDGTDGKRMQEFSISMESRYKYAVKVFYVGQAQNNVKLTMTIEGLSIPSPPASGLCFYGSNNSLKVANAPTDLTNGFTLEFWMRMLNGSFKVRFSDGTSTPSSIPPDMQEFLPDMSIPNEFEFTFTNNNEAIDFQFLSNSYDYFYPTDAFNKSLPLSVFWNDWKHVAIAIDPINSTISYYVDGLLAGFDDNWRFSFNSISYPKLELSLASSSGGLIPEITIDEFRIWNVCRTAAEIKSNYHKDLDINQLPSSLQIYYNFNQGVSGANNSNVREVYDQTSNHRNGELTDFDLNGPASNWVGHRNGAPFYVNTKQTSTALYLNSIQRGSYLTIDTPYTSFKNEITVSFWIFVEQVQTGAGIGQGKVNVEDNSKLMWNMHFWEDGTVSWNGIVQGTSSYPEGGTTRSSKSLIDGKWHQVVGTISAEYTRLYIDGNLVQQANGLGKSMLNIVTNSQINIGKDVRYAKGRFMKASFADIQIYSKALTSSEILRNFSCKITSSSPKELTQHLVTYYDFSSMLSTNDLDKSINCSPLIAGSKKYSAYITTTGSDKLIPTWIMGNNFPKEFCD